MAEKAESEGYVIVQPQMTFRPVSTFPEDVEKEEAAETLDNTLVEFQYQLDDDSMPIKRCEEEIKSKDAAGEVEPRMAEFNAKAFLYIDASLALDLRTSKCFTYLFNKANYLRNVRKKVQGLINLMRRQKPKGIILTALKHMMEKCISLHKLSKLFATMNTVYRTSQTKGVVLIGPTFSHEVKRITAICPLTEQSLYRPGQTQPALYLSKSGESASVTKVRFGNNDKI